VQPQRRLVIVGDSAIAEIAFEYFTHDSEYEVAAFAVESAYLSRERLFDVPVVAFEAVEGLFDPSDHDLFVAVGYAEMNRVRARLAAEAKRKGYALASYVSSRAFVWHNVEIGENAFVFENNVLQPFVRIGNNVTFWSGNHIGHHSVIHDNCFISSHVVVSGFCDVGAHCFLGVNATIANNVAIGSYCLIGAGAHIPRDVEPGGIYAADATLRRTQTTYERFGIEVEG
jgi:sugar O-acyltransferase (sialic acid O-acetyltransferase NeuD family)